MPFDACPEKELLSAYLLGKDDEASCAEVGGHVARCSACQTALAECSESDTLIESLRKKVVPGDFEDEPQLIESMLRIRQIGEQPEVPNPQPRQSSNPPDSLGQYRLIEMIGAGGMGRVYKAEHMRLEMIVAVKVLSADLSGNDHAVARFEREMKAVGKLNHPNIIRATDAGEENGQRYLAMEYVDGLDLGDILKAKGALRICDACEAVRQAALGMSHAHERSLIHRDLKPSNLMVTRQGQVKVLDLGLARLHSTQPGHDITGDLQIMGTADYIAPEQVVAAKRADQRSDIYSLGCTLYALVAGRPPFSDERYESSYKKLQAHDTETPISLIECCQQVSAELSVIVDKALAKLPDDRFASAEQFADALAPFTPGSDLAALVAEPLDRENSQAATSDLSKHIPFSDTDPSFDRPQPTGPGKLTSPRPTFWPETLAVLIVAGVAAGMLLLRFTTPKGTFVVEIEADQMNAEINGAQLLITDADRGESYRLTIAGGHSERELKPGRYSVQVLNPNSGLRLETHEFQIVRNHRRRIRAYFNSRRPVLAHATDRTVAETQVGLWAIEKGAVLIVVTPNGNIVLDDLQELAGDSYIGGIDFKQPFEFTSEVLRDLKQLRGLNHLEFQDPQLTEKVVDKLAELNTQILRLRFDAGKPVGLRWLQRLHTLQDLTLSGSQVGDEQAAVISTLTQVTALTLSGKQVTDQSLAHVAKMRQLGFLSLIFTQISGAGLVHLQELPNLWGLHLPYTRVNDEALAQLPALQSVTWLNLGGTRVLDDGLAYVGRLKNLDVLTLSQTRIRGSGLKHLRSANSLRKLDLSMTQIDDQTIDDLAALSQLTELMLGDCLSADAVTTLRQRLPNCTIHTTGQNDAANCTTVRHHGEVDCDTSLLPHTDPDEQIPQTIEPQHQDENQAYTQNSLAKNGRRRIAGRALPARHNHRGYSGRLSR